jgi:restriction system protein
MTHAWTVRGGRDGERERAALEQNLIILGWDELEDDLSAATSADDLAVLLHKAYPNDRDRTITNWSYQLWQFIGIMAVGDLAVMPLKNTPYVAIGRVAGGYEYRPAAPQEQRHVRPVEWIKDNVLRVALKGDLRDSMGSFRTVSELSRRDAVKRIQAVLDTGMDPGYEGEVPPPASPDDLKRDVEQNGLRQLSPRDLIGLWGYMRRTSICIYTVDSWLAEADLVVEPHFTAVQLDDLITVTNAPEAESAPETGEALQFAVPPMPGNNSQGILSWRIGSLPLPKKIATVTAQQSVQAAIELMVENDYSQLPVVDEYGRLKGVITWEEIAQAQFKRRPRLVADVTQRTVDTCRETDELLPLIDDIYKKGTTFLVVIDDENVVTGILTTADLSNELRNRAEPFIQLEEIERRLRRLVSVLSVEDLRGIYPAGNKKAEKIESAADLSIGNYRYLIDDDSRWERLDWPYSRSDMVTRLKNVADYRNSMAHWDVDAPEPDSAEAKNVMGLLRLLRAIDRDPL